MFMLAFVHMSCPFSALHISAVKGWFSYKHKHNASEDSSNISINISTKHEKNEHTSLSYVVLTRNHRDIIKSISTRRTDMFVFLVLMLMLKSRLIPSEDNIKNTKCVCSSYALRLCLYLRCCCCCPH